MANTPLPACTTGTHHDTVPGGGGHRCLTDVQNPCSLPHAHEMSMGGKPGQSERSRNEKPCNALVPRQDRLA